MAHKIEDNADQKQFEMKVEGETAFVEYIINKQGMIFLTHTEVPKAQEGQGIASEMVKQVLENIEQRDLKLAPLCPYVASYIRRNPKWKKLLADNYNV